MCEITHGSKPPHTVNTCGLTGGAGGASRLLNNAAHGGGVAQGEVAPAATPQAHTRGGSTGAGREGGAPLFWGAELRERPAGKGERRWRISDYITDVICLCTAYSQNTNPVPQ